MTRIEIEYFAEEQIIQVILDENIVDEIKIKKGIIDDAVRFTLYKNKVFKGFSATTLYDLKNL